MATNPADELNDQLGPAAQAPTPTPTPTPAPRSPVYDAAIAAIQGENAPAIRDVRRSDVQSQQLGPDRAAEILRFSQRLGVPAAVVEQNFDEIQKRARLADTPYGAMQAQAPKLSAWVAQSPYNFAVARPDLDDLTALEEVFRVTGNALRSVGAGALSFAESLSGLYQAGAEFLGDPSGAASGRVAADTFRHLAERVRGDRGQLGIIEQGFYSGIESIVFAAPSLAFGLAGGAPLSLGLLGTQVTGQSYTEARREGLTPGASLLYGGTQAAVEVITEKIPVSRLLKDVAGKTGLIKSIAHQLMPELIGENVATVLQDLNDWASLPSNAEKTFRDYLHERPSAAAITTVATITMVGGQTAALHSANQLFERLRHTAQTSQLAKTAPEQFAAVVNELAKDTPTAEVYVRSEDWTKYWQSKGEDPAAKAVELTGDPTAYEHALSIGGDLAIPIGNVAAQLASPEHQEFFSLNSRLQPNLPSQQEVDDLRDAAADVQAAIETAAAGSEAPAAAGSPLRQAITAQVLADPGFHAMTARNQVDAVTVANTYAAGVEAIVTNLARKAGEDPLDILTRYNVTIGPEGTQAAIRAVQAARQEAQETEEGAEAPAAAEAPPAGQETTEPAAPEAAAEQAPPATGQEDAETTLFQAPGPAHPALAVAPARVRDGRLVVSTRVPTGVKTQPQADVLRTDVSVVLQVPKLTTAIAAKIKQLPQVTKREQQLGDEELIEATVQRLMRNLRWLWQQYPAAWRDRARHWYVGAHRIAQELAAEHAITFEQAAGVLAVLSPQMDWFKNVSLAERVMTIYQRNQTTNPVFSEDLFAHFHRRELESFDKDKARAVAKLYGDAEVPKARARLRARLAWQRKQLVGRPWSDLTTYDQAVMLRAIDETTQSPAYRVITPEGDRGDFVRTTKGVPAKVGWGTFDFIASAITIMRDGSVETIHERLGQEHKVRSFFNNISDPWDASSVTIDTHAVAAALLEPHAGSDPEVRAALGGAPSNREVGISGTNPVYAEAYFRLAEELGVLPRELQSVTWEAVRGLFTPEQKKFDADVKGQVRALWDQHRRGTLTEEELRGRLLDAAGGIRRPAWADRPPAVAFDEGQLRRGDVLPAGPGLPARRGDARADSERPARRATSLPEGLVTPRPAVIDTGKGRPSVERRTDATRALDRFSDAKVRVYEAGGDRRDPKVRRVGLTYAPNGEFADAFARAGYQTPIVRELPATAAGAREFHRTITAAKPQIETGAQVYVYPLDEYRAMRLFLTEDGKAGFALKDDGDIVSVFSTHGRGAAIANALIALAVQEGGTKLDCFDTMLPAIYAINGFRIVKREPWNDEYRPEGWKEETFSRYNNGHPDVVYMEFDPAALKTGPITLYQDPLPNPTNERWATSRLQLAVEQAKQERASGRDWKNIIKGAKIGVNADEFQLANVDALDDRQQYTREEVLGYLRQNEVPIRWHVMDAGGVSMDAWRKRTEEIFERRVAEKIQEFEDRDQRPIISELEIEEREDEDDDGNAVTTYVVEEEEFSTREAAEARAEELRLQYEDFAQQEFVNDVRNLVSYSEAEADARQELIDEAERENRVAKYGDYQLDRGFHAEPDSYREVFLQAETRAPGFAGLTADESQVIKRKYQELYGLTLTQAAIEADLPEITKFREQRIAEMNTRIDAAIAMLDKRLERESGWTPADHERFREHRRILQKLRASGDYVWHEQKWEDGHDLYEGIENPIVRLRFNVRQVVTETKPRRELNQEIMQAAIAAQTEQEELSRRAPLVGAERARYQTLADIIERGRQEMRDAQAQTSTTGQRVLFLEEVQPPHPSNFEKMPELFQKNWRELAFKWALRHAAELGVDGIAWTTGQQQRDRYRLSRAMKSISWTPNHYGYKRDVRLTPVRQIRVGEQTVYRVKVDRNGDIVESREWEQLEGRSLVDVVGPELAARIMAEPAGTIADQELDVGGLGLARLYDQDFPNVVKKLPVVKKQGGQLGTVAIQTGAGASAQPALLLTPAMQTALLQGQQTLFQEDEEGKRGSITIAPTGINIRFLADADLSTFLHETGHLYLHLMGELVEKIGRGDPATWTAGQQALVDDHQKILKWLGVTSRDQIGREQHEQFARGFEAYLMRGQAPSGELRPAFARFRTWLTQLYKSLLQLNVNLTDEIVDVFDRLVASEEAIEAARAEAKLQPIFTTPEQAFEVAGLGPTEWQGYQKILAAAHEEAKDALQARLMRELQRERETWWKTKKAEVRRQVEQELRNQPAYRALLYLQRGELPDGSKVDEPVKIAKDSIVEKLGAERLKTLPLPYVYSVEGGLDVDAAAELLGFTSGDALLTAIAGTEKLDVVATRETNARMQAEFGNMRIDGTLRQAARAAVQSDGYQAVLTAELRALARAARLARPIVRAARLQEAQEEASARRALRRSVNAATVPAEQLRAIADERIGKIAPKDLKPQLYWLAAQRAAGAASKAVADGRYEDAVAEKQKQRMAVAMHRAAVEALDDVEVLAKYAKRLGEKAAQARLGKAGESYQAQVNALLNKFEFQDVSNRALDRRKTLVEWVQDRQAEGLPIEVPAEVLETAQKVNYRSASIEQLRNLRETLKAIEHLARLKNRLLASEDKRQFDEARDALVTSIRDKNKARPPQLEFRRSEERKHTVAEWFASHAKIATLAQQLDGNVDGGPLWNLIVRPLNEAADREAERRRVDGQRLNAIVKKYYPGRELARWSQKMEIPAINASLSKEAMLAIALNWGNETSRDRILSDPKRRWTRQQVEAILDQLDAHDWQFVQEVWDFVDSYWKEISDKTFRITGLRPEKVDAVPVDTRHGRFRGGYYPLAYDHRLAPSPGTNQITTDAKLQLAGAYIRATTRRGHLKSRLEHVELPVRLELGVLFEHLDQVIHDLTHHEALIDVSRVLRDHDVSAAIHDVAGDPVYRQFTSALTDIAVGRRPGSGLVDRAAAFAKTGAQIAGLGLNMWTAAQQPLGLFNGAARVGPVWVARGLTRWLRDAATMENTLTWIRDVSPFMRNRATTQNQDIAELRRRLAEPGGWFDVLVRRVSGERVTQQNITDSFLWHISLAQRVADVPTWLGQYEKSKAEGKSEEDAIALADQAVRDSQGGGQTVDLAQVQRGGDVARLFMTFYTYGSTVFNQTARAYGRTTISNPVTYARFLGDLSLIYFFPALATVVLARLLKGAGEDDDDLWDVSADVLKEVGASALNTMVFMRELGGLLRASNRGYEGPAGTRLLQQIYRLGGQVAQGEVDEGLWHALNQTAGVLFRYPAAQFQRTVDGFVALQEGETQNPLALIFGPPPED